MSTEKNRTTAIKMVEQISRGILDDTLLCADACWWIPGKGTVSRREFQGIVDSFNSMKKSELRMTIHGITAEGDRVAIEAESHGELVNGEIYNNTYHFLFLFENGKIKLAKEYNDSKYAADTFASMGGIG
jgi:ketosteroid isomerase-like protein